MGDKTSIAWCDATVFTARNGRYTRVQTYKRKDTSRPGQHERREKARQGLRWCRGCQSWLPQGEVRSGVCQTHANEEYRAQYANGSRVAIAARVHARKRSVGKLPANIEGNLELFDGQCAYCGGNVDGWDHVIPVSAQGKSVAGNLVPCCRSCNSSKRSQPLSTWARKKTIDPDLLARVIEYAVTLQGEVDAYGY